MLRRSITAIDRLSPALEFVVLQTGSKTYGCHLLSQRSEINMPLPLSESHPRLPSPHAEQLFYNAQLDFLSSYAKDKSWNWCETRPDIIIGFVPNGGFYTLATSLGIFLALWKQIEGEGSECPFPGSGGAWKALWNQGSSDMLARQAIHISLMLPISRKGEAFNVADEEVPGTWATKWPVICSYFGLKGTPPLNEGAKTDVRGYLEKHMDMWKEMEVKNELKRGVAKSLFCSKRFEFALLTLFDFDRQFDMKKMYGSGFNEERTPGEAWGGVFDRMRRAKIIPS
jgi:PRISE-like Rossmann-fold domain